MKTIFYLLFLCCILGSMIGGIFVSVALHESDQFSEFGVKAIAFSSVVAGWIFCSFLYGIVYYLGEILDEIKKDKKDKLPIQYSFAVSFDYAKIMEVIRKIKS